MTEKLFEDNSLLRVCTAEVTSCLQVAGEYLIELDRTVFFPEGGGQLSDQGFLDDLAVQHVSTREGRIYHHCAQPLEVGAKVMAQLNWPLRLDRMQQHCGEHLFSWACWKLFDAHNVGFHMHEDWVAIDLDKQLTMEQLYEAELLTNQLIWENRPITVRYVDSREAATLPGMRKFNEKLEGLLRIVSVEGADVCTCCGTHPPATGMVGSVQLVKAEKHKQGIRVEFLCGQRALLAHRAQNQALLALGNKFSVKPLEVPVRIEKLTATLEELQERLKQQTLQLLTAQLQERYQQAPKRRDGVRVVTLVSEEAQAAKLLSSTIEGLEQAIVLVINPQAQRLSYLLALGKNTVGDCRSYSKLLNEALDGRGGGKPHSAQGGAPYCEDWEARLQGVVETLLNE